MKLFLIALLSSSCIYSMQNIKTKEIQHNKQPRNSYYDQAIAEIIKKYQNEVQKSENESDIISPITGFLKHDNNWHKVTIIMGSKL